MERICKNCRLFDEASSTCSVKLLILGKIMRDIPVDPNDKCLWETVSNPETGECLADYIKEVRFRVVNKTTGEPTSGEGKVLVEYEDELFENRNN